MAVFHIKHAFVSTKPDSPDASIVSSSEWNASEIGSGGTHGQMILQDGSSPTGLSTVDGPAGFSTNESYTGASPSPALADTTITMTTAAYILLFVNVVAVVSDSSAATVLIKRDGVTLVQYGALGTGIASCQSLGLFESAGVHTYTVVVTIGSGTFTQLTASIIALRIGSL